MSSLRIILFKCMEFGPGGTRGKECRRHKTCSFDPWVRKNSLKEGMATHSSILPWSIPWTVESGGLPSMGSQATFTHYSLSHMLSHFSHVQLFVISWTVARQAPLFTKFSRPEYWKWVARILEVGSCSLLQGIFPTQGSNPGLTHHRQTLYHVSYQGSPRILEWVAYPFSRGSSRPRNWTRVSCIAGGFFSQLNYQGSSGTKKDLSKLQFWGWQQWWGRWSRGW